MVKNLRPRQGADAIGVGLSTFWRLASTDPDFPQLIRLSPRCTVVREADLQAYMDLKAAKAGKAPQADAEAVPA